LWFTAVEDCSGICGGTAVDADEDGICDDIDDCVGAYDACDVCNGPGTQQCWDNTDVCGLENCSTYYSVGIEDTGESSLFIFRDTISSLSIGDQLGVYDAAGVLDGEGNTGELLVGSGIWIGEQLEVVGIQSQDLSQFGGPILPGAVVGHEMMLKVWKADEMQEYDVSYSLESGSGTFNSLFSAISEVSLCEIPEGACDCDGNILDECGVCNGNGAVYECGCTDILEGFCDCDGSIEDCFGVCGGDSVVGGCDEVCGSTAVEDCSVFAMELLSMQMKMAFAMI